jgi:hypothetical protein
MRSWCRLLAGSIVAAIALGAPAPGAHAQDDPDA